MQITKTQIVMVGSFFILLAAKVIFDKDLSWVLVLAPLWAPYAFLFTLFGMIKLLDAILYFVETPEQRAARKSLEEARAAINNFEKRYGRK